MKTIRIYVESIRNEKLGKKLFIAGIIEFVALVILFIISAEIHYWNLVKVHTLGDLCIALVTPVLLFGVPLVAIIIQTIIGGTWAYTKRHPSLDKALGKTPITRDPQHGDVPQKQREETIPEEIP